MGSDIFRFRDSEMDSDSRLDAAQLQVCTSAPRVSWCDRSIGGSSGSDTSDSFTEDSDGVRKHHGLGYPGVLGLSSIASDCWDPNPLY
jgi:hypothetical protein